MDEPLRLSHADLTEAVHVARNGWSPLGREPLTPTNAAALTGGCDPRPSRHEPLPRGSTPLRGGRSALRGVRPPLRGVRPPLLGGRPLLRGVRLLLRGVSVPLPGVNRRFRGMSPLLTGISELLVGMSRSFRLISTNWAENRQFRRTDPSWVVVTAHYRRHCCFAIMRRVYSIVSADISWQLSHLTHLSRMFALHKGGNELSGSHPEGVPALAPGEP